MECTNRNCPAYAKCFAPYRGSRCKATRATYGLEDPLTNADRIRAMTDAELAEFLTEHHFGDKLWCERWLKQEVEDDTAI